MRKTWKAKTAIWMACGLMAAQMTGCGTKQESGISESSNALQTSQEADLESETAEDSAGTKTVTDAESGTVTAALGENQEKSIVYQEEDLDVSWDEKEATGIVMDGSEITVVGKGAHTDGSTVVIEKAGTYVLSGFLEDGQVRIEAGENELVHLILNGAEISNQSSSAIFSSEKSKVVVTLEAGTKNRLSDGAEYTFAEGEDEPNAALFAKGDLTINGTGELELAGNYECGIRSKGDLKVISGVLSVNAKEDGLKGKDCVIIRDGQIDLTVGKDGIKSNNDENADKGYIWIDGGVISIAAEDDGIQAETALIVNGGEIEISKCQEGLAGKSVDLLGGIFIINAQDDGINAAGPAETEREKMMDQEGVYLRIAGGELRVNAQADGIDSNGDFYMEGGTLYLSGPTGRGNGILDYNGTAVLTGGTMIAAGTSEMMQVFGENSTQNYLVVYYDESQAEGTTIRLLDESGEELAAYAPDKAFSAAILTAPGLEEGKTYHVMTGDQDTELTINGLETSYGTPSERVGGMGRGDGQRPEGMGGPRDGRGFEGMEPPEDGKDFEGMEPPEDGKDFEGMKPSKDGQRPEGMIPPVGREKKDRDN